MGMFDDRLQHLQERVPLSGMGNREQEGNRMLGERESWLSLLFSTFLTTVLKIHHFTAG